MRFPRFGLRTLFVLVAIIAAVSSIPDVLKALGAAGENLSNGRHPMASRQCAVAMANRLIAPREQLLVRRQFE